MKAAPFAYHAPEEVTDVVALLREHGDDAKPLAGGQSLLPILALRLTRFAHLIDITRVDALTGVDAGAASVRIGATTRQRTVERDERIATAVPLLARALPWIGHFQIRNRGTIGGSIAHADPASELPAVAVALGATMHAVGPDGARTIAAGDFFAGTWTTALADDEILTAVEFPTVAAGSRHGSAITETARRHGDFAIAGAAADLRVGADGRIERAGVALFGVASTPWNATAAASRALVGARRTDIDIDAVAQAAVDGIDPSDDIHATGAQRTRIARHLTAQAVTAALQEAYGA